MNLTRILKANCCAAAFLSAAISASAQSVPLINAGFEANWTGTGDPSYPLYETGYVASPTGPAVGWTFHTGSSNTDWAGVTNNNTLWGGTAFEGTRFAWLQDGNSVDPFGSESTYIEQSFTLTSIADSLVLSFEQANRSAYSSGRPSVLAVAIDGVIVGSFNTATQAWVAESLDLPTLSAGTHELAFSNATPSANGEVSAYLDAVTLGPSTVAAVPEPSSWMLLLAGFGLAGIWSRRIGRR